MKMIIADLDGTLVSKKEVTNETKETIHALKQSGHLFTIATGRHMDATKDMVDLFDVHLPVICGNGSIIYDFDAQKIIHKQTILDKTVLDIMSLCDIYNVDFLMYTTKDIVTTHEGYHKLSSKIGDFKVKVVNRKMLGDFIHLGVIKILVIDERDDVIEDMKKRLDIYKDLHYVQSQPTFLDIGHVLSTKGRALSLLAKHLCISLKDVIAIGDQENDISMIEAAGIGIAMGDGQEMLKKKADYITSPFHENGFTKAINDLLLAKKQRNT